MGNKASHSTSSSQAALDTVLSRPSALDLSLFSLHSTAHHGVPSNARVLAFCGLQGILAVGTASGTIKLYGAEGLEVLIERPASASHLAVGVTHLEFTARQRLIVGYTDSSLRVYDLTSGTALCCVSDTWTTSVIMNIETMRYINSPFFFVATDDGHVHVIHEDTGRVSTYVIRPQDCTIPNAEVITAMASHPRDANLLLLAYDMYPTVLLWDFAKRKVIREFSVSGKARKPTQSPHTSNKSSANGEQVIVSSPQSLSWHCSGKRFVAGYKQGGFAVFRVDKPNGLYRCIASSEGATAIKQITWVCATPTSKHAALPGAIVFSGGRADMTESKLLTVVYPPSEGRSADDTLSDLYKAEKLTWSVATIESANHAEIAAFVAAQEQVDYCRKPAPLALIVLSGNPLDGCLPVVSVQSLPCFVKLCDGDREDWIWQMDRLPAPVAIPPLLQISPLKTFVLVSMSSTDCSLQEDLVTSWNQARYNPMFQLMESGDFEWPINGGSVAEPILKAFGSDSATGIAPNSTMLVTGHANGYVMFWEVRTAGDRVSKGTIRLIHVVDVPLQMSPTPVSSEVTCLTFCADSRTLVAGFASGEVVVLEFGQLESDAASIGGVQQANDREEGIAALDCKQTQDPNETGLSLQGESQNEAGGFRTLFSIHVHTEPISKLVVSSLYGYVGIADAAGMVSLVETKTQMFQLLVCDIGTCDESTSVDSLLMSELIQTTEIPGSCSSPSTSLPQSNKTGPKGSRTQFGASNGDANLPNTMLHREVVPVLFVGRGSGKLEMYHVQSSTKMGEMLVDPKKTSSLSSIIMVDSDGKRLEMAGREWVKQSKKVDHTCSGLDSTALTDVAEHIQSDADAKATTDQQDQQVAMRNADYELTQQFVTEAQNEQAKAADTDKVPAHVVDKVPWTPNCPVEVAVPAGSLGLHLFMEVEQHAVVKGFAEGNNTALLLASKGICTGHTLIAINDVDVSFIDRDLVCRVLEKLREREKVLVFAQGFQSPEVPVKDDSEALNSPAIDSRNGGEYERPRFLVCTCGRSIHVVQATVPRAAEMAMGPKEIVAEPLASVELQGVVLVTSVVRVPVGEGIETCLVVIDQSNRVYVLSLLSLQPIWETEWQHFGFGLSCSGLVDGVVSGISYNGEIVVANGFGEMERFSVLAEATAMESAMLERMCVKTRLHLPERAIVFDRAASCSETESGKKRGIAADAGKMLKKLVLSVTQEAIDLNKVFHFSTEEDERKRLMGERSSAAKEAESITRETETGLSATKDSLMQAQQRLAERGEKLNDLGLKTEQMKKTSEDFYRTMKALNEQNANKKWYEF